MKCRRLGRSGLMISEMVLGTMNFGNPDRQGGILQNHWQQPSMQASICLTAPMCMLKGRARRSSAKPFRVTANGKRSHQGIDVAQRLAERAAGKGCTLAQLAVAWVLHQQGITGTIIGPRTLDHFKDLLGAVEVSLDASDLEFCDALVPPETQVSDHFNSAGWRKGG